jgi:F0F1-type ATP synthase membrane subunit c/vacuolar-type H+-ATPase subunit K
MKCKQDHVGRAGLIILTVLFFLSAGAVEVLAAEGGGGWRPTYDIIMKWVARNTAYAGDLMRTMLVGQAVSQSTAIYAMVISLVLIFVV